MKKNENGATTYYVRSTVLGGAVVAEVDSSGGSAAWVRLCPEAALLAMGQNWPNQLIFEDTVTKSKRVTDVYGNVISTVELDPWGADTNRSSNSAFQPQSFTSYTRDLNGDQDAMARRYSVSGRFSQPDPYSGSYDFSDPQSLNRYAYVGNDPVNRKDPSGLNDYGLGPPPPVPIFRPDVLVINVNAPRYPVGGLLGRLLGNDAMAIVESATEGIEPVGPTIAFGPKYQNLIQPFKDAFDEAVDRLKNKRDCAKLFGGLEKALSTLNSATYRLFDEPIKTTYKDGKFVPSVTGAMTASGNTVFINLSGPFFNGPDLKMSGNRSFKANFGTGLKGADLAALLVLHELGHQIGKWGSDAGIGDKDKNLEHTMAAYKACF